IGSVRGPITRSGRKGGTAMDTDVLGPETTAPTARICWTAIICMLMAAPARGDEPPRNQARAESRPTIAVGKGQQPTDRDAPRPRSFRLGFTPDDLLDTPEVGKTVSDVLSGHADLVAFHIGLGVP